MSAQRPGPVAGWEYALTALIFGAFLILAIVL